MRRIYHPVNQTTPSQVRLGPLGSVVWTTVIASAVIVGLLSTDRMDGILTPPQPLLPEMISLPGGSFERGCSDGEACKPEELPAQRVTITPFAIGSREVTVGEFGRFVMATAYVTDAENSGCGGRMGRHWSNPGYEQGDDHPVVCVSWNDAMAYAQWLVDQTGLAYRLPSEAEWEYAARGGSDTRYHWGMDASQRCVYANASSLVAAGCDDGVAIVAATAQYRPNAFGLYDTAGNVWEWTADCWHPDYQSAPSDGSSWGEADNGQCAGHVVRGGGWSNDISYLRPAARTSFNTDGSANDQGFRLAQSLAQ